MSQDDITQIRVGNSPVGIIGFKTVMEDLAEEYGEKPDHEVFEELLSRLEKRILWKNKIGWQCTTKIKTY